MTMGISGSIVGPGGGRRAGMRRESSDG